MSVLKLKKSNCKNCYKCIRHCPVKSIKFSDGQANIVEDECILCGMCFVACPQNAKEIRNDVSVAKQLISSGKPVWVSLAPSFIANYDGVGITSMTNALKSLGFAGVEETAAGAQLVTAEYEKMVASGEHDVIISSCCHTVNTLIQKYYPQALSKLAMVKSPMLAHCEALKQKYPDCHTVFIGPCLSKKAEAESYAGAVDCVLTFEELTGWFKDENVTLVQSDDEQTKQERAKTRLYPTTSGILRSMNKDNSDYLYMAIDGVENCASALRDIIAGNVGKCFIEMSACVNSCIGGPAMDKKHEGVIHERRAIDNFAGKGKFDVEALPSMDKNMPFIGVAKKMPGSAAIDEILRKMNKTTPAQELNCGSCGYNTCREKAVAILQGKADLTMCLPYLKEKAESFSDNIITNTPNGIMVLNEDLEVQQLNRAAREIMNIKNLSDVLGCPVVRILDPISYMEVMNTEQNIHNKRVYLAEYGKYVEETIIYDKSYHIIMSIMRDITNEEVQRTKKEKNAIETIEITDKVIDKQMRVVQEIASLLGETTAETKIALTKLKENLNND